MFRQRAFVWWWVVQCYSMKWKTNFDRKRWYNTNILFLWIFSKICSGMYLRVWRRASSLRLGMILLPWSSTISNKYLLYLSSKIFKSQWANEQCILVKDVAWRCANFIWFLKSCYQMMAQIWHQKNLIWKLGHIFEKAMTSPLKQDRLAKAYNALTRSRFREVTEDSPDYDEYYDEETWVFIPCRIETKICATNKHHLRLQTNFYDALCFVLKVRIYDPICVVNEYHVFKIFKSVKEIGVLGGKLCATNRLSGMCCFSGFPVAQ